MNADALSWIDTYSRDGHISESRLLSIAVRYADFQQFDAPSGERWYCNTPGLNGDKCYAVISRDGMSAEYFSDARLKREKKADAAKMAYLIEEAKKAVLLEIASRGLIVRPKKTAA